MKNLLFVVRSRGRPFTYLCCGMKEELSPRQTAARGECDHIFWDNLIDISYEQFHRVETDPAVAQARRAFVHREALPLRTEDRGLRSAASEGSGKQGARFQAFLRCTGQVTRWRCRKGANVNFFDSKGSFCFMKTTSAT